MKVQGSIALSDKFVQATVWIDAPPHIRMKLKQVFPKLDKHSFGHVSLALTPESAVDLEWFCLRYPMEWKGEARAVVERLSAAHRARLSELESIMSPDYQPRDFAIEKPLRHYQGVAVEVFWKNDALLVGDDLGLGKTVTAMGTLTRRESLPALVACPVHLQRQWMAMLGEFLPLMNAHIIKQTKAYPLPPCDVFIISYSKLASWGEYFVEAGLKTLIFDECQELRRTGDGAKKSKKYHAAKAIADRAQARLGLSATPVYNYGDEIFNILEVLSPGRLGTREEFHREWCDVISAGKWKVRDPHALGLYLRDQFLMLRRTRADVGLELPQVERSVTTIPFTEKVLEEVESSATELARLVLTAEFEKSGEAARQLDAKLRQATGVAKAPFVAGFVRMLCESGERVLLFGWHREVYDVWKERLKDLHPVFYTGEEGEAAKNDSVRRFLMPLECEEKYPTLPKLPRVLIMSLRSGLGVDGLQKVCRTAVFGELDWSPGVHEQCIGRLNRDGVGAGVLSYFLVADGGSDPVVADVLGLKRAQHEGMMNLTEEGTAIGLQQDGGSRVRDLAIAYLQRRGLPVPERAPRPVSQNT